jgi:hypothetical protein
VVSELLGELVLAGVFDEDIDAGVFEAGDECGWELRVARRVRRVEPPAQDDLLTLRLMDPHGWFRS